MAKKSLKKVEDLKVDSPIGGLRIAFDPSSKVRSLRVVRIPANNRASLAHARREKVKRELKEYFAVKRRSFSVRCDLNQGTDFQRRVWSQIDRIPYGATRSYLEIAQAIGKPRAVRAVAQACAKNPVGILRPCHRVIRHSGRIGGYAWGTKRKAWLLNLEKRSLQGPSI